MLIPNRTSIRTCSVDETAFVQANTPDQAARPSINVHTGAKTRFGGFHDGLRSSRYQGPTVAVEPPTPSINSTVKAAITIGKVMTCPMGLLPGERLVSFYVVGVALLSNWATAETNWAGANGFGSMMLFGTPLDDQSAALSPLM